MHLAIAFSPASRALETPRYFNALYSRSTRKSRPPKPQGENSFAAGGANAAWACYLLFRNVG
jgi:hypothetical protein